MSAQAVAVTPDMTEARIRSEYREMPGLKLTAAQACRFWNLGIDEGRMALDSLVEARVLRRTADGHYLLLAGSPTR
jgi:hypothetical protein